MSGRTRWDVSANDSYGPTFDRLVREGADVHGEARLADVLLPGAAACSTRAPAWVGWRPSWPRADTA